MSEKNSSFGIGKLLVFLIVLGIVFVAVKIIIGWVLTLLKWALIGVVALFITWLIFRPSKTGD